jgi:hypothetical protein
MYKIQEIQDAYVRLIATEIGRLLAEGRSLMDASGTDNDGDDEHGESDKYKFNGFPDYEGSGRFGEGESQI